MIILFVLLLIIVGIIVIYLSLETEKKSDKNLNFDYKQTIFYKQLNNIDIKNEKILALKQEISKYIVGSENLINAIIVGLLCSDHILVEGLPGLAKTKTILVISKLLGLDFKRIQFTPDLLPSDIIGGEIFNKNTNTFEVFKGPIFTNLLLADEINRATPKVQSALLEAMQEKKVTIGNYTFDLPTPFFVMASQNPIEQEGTFPLPEAQIDRFLFKVIVDYPSFDEEKKILDCFDKKIDMISPILSKSDLLQIQEEIKNIQISDFIKNYIIQLVHSIRKKDNYILLGPSPRGIISLKKASSVIAYLKGKDEVTIDDVQQVALLALRHRVKCSYLLLSENKDIDEILINKFIKIRDY